MPAVSIMLTIYNVEKFLPRCLDSVINQTFTDIEIICVDDCSPDGSAAILADYAARDPRIRILTHPKNKGLMWARKTAYDVATGEWFFFLDSDDYIAPDAIELLLKEAEKLPEAKIIVGERYFTGGRKCSLQARANTAGPDASNYIRATLGWTSPTVCGNIFHRSLFEGTTYTTFLHQSYSEDRLLLLQMLLQHNPATAVVNAPVYYYCLNNESLTRINFTNEKVASQFEALFWCYDYLEEHAPGTYTTLNNAMILRHQLMWLELGFSAPFLRSLHPTANTLLRFDSIRRNLSLQAAIHAKACAMPFYRKSIVALRRLKRRIQGRG